jgi:benzoyl-CoA reductase/2-hydroxyglutaryl-CoA dehydratase subunit BcrC/BadD/HgdB
VDEDDYAAWSAQAFTRAVNEAFKERLEQVTERLRNRKAAGRDPQEFYTTTVMDETESRIYSGVVEVLSGQAWEQIDDE